MVSLALLTPSLITKSSLFGIVIAFSPLHIGVVSLLLLGRSPVQRALTYVAGWAAANALAITVLMVIGEAFSISLSHGEREQVLIDLLGAGALIGLGLYQLTPQANLGEEGMALKLMNQLPDFSSLALVGVGAASALLTPENLVFYLKEAGLLLLNEPGLTADAEVTGIFTLVASSLLLLPPLAWLVSGGAIREPLAKLENWLQHKAEWLVGVLALFLGAYLLYEGLHGLNQMGALA
ncbi:GAP family protein [Cyanobium sp. WAJ14-Wanaka]|uniref:GAP family protein n=1 Tax=Cyanobium sp. WAJ14-Wanaka TaxID=2823725 RepID=UPI0020CF597E|nr:GAP family protein [Cyanobium sp. WAJ14-Wanaka]MCP9774936.1 GAP family protein [Cyanobium sp. WAJ14-Wanaka]